MNDTVKIKKPNRRVRDFEPPQESETTNNLKQPSTSNKAYLNFTVTPEFKVALKTYCVENGITMSYFLMEAFTRLKKEITR